MYSGPIRARLRPGKMGDCDMSFWNADLTTEDGAQSAAMNGGTACFVLAGLTVLAGVFLGYGATGDRAEFIGMVVYLGGAVAISLIAGWRLRSGKGVVWGSLVAALLVFEIIVKLVTMTGLIGIIFNVILLVVTVNGVRGALALRRGIEGDLAEVFE